jgi:hypothetical protein
MTSAQQLREARERVRKELEGMREVEKIEFSALLCAVAILSAAIFLLFYFRPI